MSYLHPVKRGAAASTPPRFDVRHKVEEDRKEQIGFVLRRFRVDPENGEQVRAAAEQFGNMSIATRTLLAIEMREQERSNWTADYDPFEHRSRDYDPFKDF